MTTRPTRNIVSLLAFLLVLALLAWQWYSNRQHYKSIERDLATRLADLDTKNQQGLALAKNAEERSQQALARGTLLEQKLSESRTQQAALETLYYELANNKETRAISEIEQLLTIANQQLQLAGNSKSAMFALQSAASRLETINDPLSTPLAASVANDIRRLQHLPAVDTASINKKLSQVAQAIDTLPLVSERHPQTKIALQPNRHEASGVSLIKEIWQDIKNLVRVERIDRPEPPLLTPEQRFFLRENLRLRLMTARLALLQHDETSYRADLTAALAWLKTHFDLTDKRTQTELEVLSQLASGTIVIELPDINESLNLAREYKNTLENHAQSR